MERHHSGVGEAKATMASQSRGMLGDGMTIAIPRPPRRGPTIVHRSSPAGRPAHWLLGLVVLMIKSAACTSHYCETLGSCTQQLHQRVATGTVSDTARPEEEYAPLAPCQP